MTIFIVMAAMDEFFLDASYAIALAATTDEHHSRAVAIADQLRSTGAHLVTTRAVTLEIGNALSRRRYRGAAIKLLSSIEGDPLISIMPLSDLLYAQGFALFVTRMDKEWSLTDCISFAVMRERGVTAALTADNHFRQAGFRALLLDAS